MYAIWRNPIRSKFVLRCKRASISGETSLGSWTDRAERQCCSVRLDDGADERIHLVHVDTRPEKPHAEHAHEGETPGEPRRVERNQVGSGK